MILLLLVSAALIALITLGGWSKLEGARPIALAYLPVYVALAFYVARWNRGVLPVVAALAGSFAVIAAAAAPAWFDRAATGFSDPALDPALLGVLTLALVPAQVLLAAFAMRGFAQRWNVEVDAGGRTAPSGRAARGDERADA